MARERLCQHAGPRRAQVCAARRARFFAIFRFGSAWLAPRRERVCARHGRLGARRRTLLYTYA